MLRPMIRRARLAVTLAVLGVAPFAAGCQSMYFLTNPNAKRDVKAEYGRIGDRSIAVIVWADQSTLDEYSRVRFQIGKAIAHYLKEHLPKAKLISADAVRTLQSDSGRDWESLTNAQLCAELKSDLLLRVDLLEYTARAGQSRQLRKASVAATLNLFECGKTADLDPVFADEIKTMYPPESLHGISETSDSELMHEAVEHFAQVTARKFYDHEVLLQEDRR